MKIQRYKRVQKVLKFYKMFGIQAPYRILLDGTICRAALEAKINIQDQLSNYLGNSINIITTQCVIQEVEALSKIVKNLYGTWLVVKQFNTHQCGHKKERKSALECIKSLIKEKNPNRYILATMDDDLRNYVNENLVGVPIIYLHDKSPTIEKPSKISENYMQSKDEASSSHELQRLMSLKRKFLEEEDAKPKKKKRKGANPLSCLKSKKKRKITNKTALSDKPKRKRNKHKEEDINACIKKVFFQN